MTSDVPELRPHAVDAQCPKCSAKSAIDIAWHTVPVLRDGSLSSLRLNSYPCAGWPATTRLEHLCYACRRCGHAWASKTADAE